MLRRTKNVIGGFLLLLLPAITFVWGNAVIEAAPPTEVEATTVRSITSTTADLVHQQGADQQGADQQGADQQGAEQQKDPDVQSKDEPQEPVVPNKGGLSGERDDPKSPGDDQVAPTSKIDEIIRRGEAGLESISYPWKENLDDWEITFHPGRKGVYGYTLVKEKRIEVYVRSDQSEALLRHVIAHEIGHAIDVTYNDGEARRRWQEARGIENEPWWPNEGASDFHSGAGDFAESFAAWQVGSELFRSKLGPAPTDQQIDLLQELVS